MSKINKYNFVEGEAASIDWDPKKVPVIPATIALGLVGLWFKTEGNRVWFYVVAGAVAAVAIAVAVLYFVVRNKKTVPSPGAYYIVEDVLVHVIEHHASEIKHSHPYVYDFKFSQNGTYQCTVYGKKEPSHPDADYSAARFSKPGDKVYLVISAGSRRVVKCYNARYYSIDTQDFVLRDGKYYVH